MTPPQRATCATCGVARTFMGTNAARCAESAVCTKCGARLTPERGRAGTFDRTRYPPPERERRHLSDQEWHDSQRLLLLALGT